jgi:DNA-nicking Smr family endonuclease
VADPARLEDDDAAARARLDALVGVSATFDVTIDDDGVRALRRGAHSSALRELDRFAYVEVATLDLHGARVVDVRARVARFVRELADHGVTTGRIVHGKGLHSEGGVLVLRDAAREALTTGATAARVLAFATAPAALGGTGALLVRLVAAARGAR